MLENNIVAVGTAVASCPPHRPVLAQLAHTVPTSECATPSRSPAARVSPALYCTGVLWLGVQHRPMPGSLLGRPPSLRALRRRFTALVRALRRYYAVARLPAAVHEGLTAHRVLPPVRPTAWRTTTGSPGSRAWSFSACLGSQTPQDLCALAFARAAVLPSGAPTPWASRNVISKLNTLPTDTPDQRFKCSLATALTWLGAGVVRYAFPVRLFHSLLQAGLSRRYPELNIPPAYTPIQRFECNLTAALAWLGARLVRYSLPV